MLVFQKLVAMTGVAMTFRYQAFTIQDQNFNEVGVALDRLFQASSLDLPLYVTWDNWKNVFLLGRTTVCTSWKTPTDKN